jgi:hypothetical protein
MWVLCDKYVGGSLRTVVVACIGHDGDLGESSICEFAEEAVDFFLGDGWVEWGDVWHGG